MATKINDKRLERVKGLNNDFEPLIMELIVIPFNAETCISVLKQMQKDKDPVTLSSLLIVSLCQ